MIHVGQALAVALLVYLVARIRWERSPERRKRRVLLLLLYICAAHLAIIVMQRDNWPISNYRLLHGRARLETGQLFRIGFFGVDKQGREWRIDPYAWRGISDWHLQYWFEVHFAALNQEERKQVVRWLYGLAEGQRGELARGKTSPSILGPLTAPQWWMFPRELAVPAEPYVALRVYKDTWYPGPVLIDSSRITRKLVDEWRAH